MLCNAMTQLICPDPKTFFLAMTDCRILDDTQNRTDILPTKKRHDCKAHHRSFLSSFTHKMFLYIASPPRMSEADSLPKKQSEFENLPANCEGTSDAIKGTTLTVVQKKLKCARESALDGENHTLSNTFSPQTFRHAKA